MVLESGRREDEDGESKVAQLLGGFLAATGEAKQGFFCSLPRDPPYVYPKLQTRA